MSQFLHIELSERIKGFMRERSAVSTRVMAGERHYGYTLASKECGISKTALYSAANSPSENMDMKTFLRICDWMGEKANKVITHENKKK